MRRVGWVVALCLVVPGFAFAGTLEKGVAAAGASSSALQAAIRAVGEAVSQGVDPPEARLRDALVALDRAEASVAALRERGESAAGESESALEALYESDDWLRLDHLDGELQYWRGWAHFRLAGKLAPEKARSEFRAARRDFVRAMRNIRDPNVAQETLLATAIAERGAGESARSSATLARIREIFSDAPAEFLGRLRLESARSARAEGDLTKVLIFAEGADLATPYGRDLRGIALRALLDTPTADRAALRASASEMLSAGGDAAARANAILEAAKLPSATYKSWVLGEPGAALHGLALLREKRFEDASSLLGGALRGSLPGLRRDVVMARLAEAQLQSKQAPAAFATCKALRERFPKTPLRAQVARFAYAAAGNWVAAKDRSGDAANALERASDWVLADAPASDEASEVRVRRAMATAQRSDPERALRVLDALPSGGAGAEAVSLQKALLRSAKLQTSFEQSLRRSDRILGQARRLDALLHKIPKQSELAAEYRTDLAIARARATTGLGHAGAFETLGKLKPSFEVERTRIVALWMNARYEQALTASVAFLRSGSGSERDRYAWALPIALAASEHKVSGEHAAPLGALLSLLGERAPDDLDPELVVELALRAARARIQSGDRESGLASLARAFGDASNPIEVGLANLVLGATLYEEAGRPDAATELWHRIAERSSESSDQWLHARLGIARSLRATPGRAQDGCDVAHSLVLSGRSLPEELGQKLRAIAASCSDASLSMTIGTTESPR